MNGKVVVITGALGALGKVVTEEALARGARVAGRRPRAIADILLRQTGSNLAASICPMRRKPKRRSTPPLRTLAGWMP